MLARRCFGLVLLGLAMIALPAAAGPNAGGVLYVHTNDAFVGTPTMATGPNCPNFPDCAPGVPAPPCDVDPMQFDSSSGLGEYEDTAFWLVAAFPPETCPRLKAIGFSVRYNTEFVVIREWGHEPAGLPSTVGGFPDSHGTFAFVWDETQTAQYRTVAWFTAYAYGGPQQFEFWANPSHTQWTVFADDGQPPVADPIGGFGILGMLGDPGFNPPLPTPTRTSTWGQIKAGYRFAK